MEAVTAFPEGGDVENVTEEPVHFFDCIKKR